MKRIAFIVFIFAPCFSFAKLAVRTTNLECENKIENILMDYKLDTRLDTQKRMDIGSKANNSEGSYSVEDTNFKVQVYGRGENWDSVVITHKKKTNNPKEREFSKKFQFDDDCSVKEVGFFLDANSKNKKSFALNDKYCDLIDKFESDKASMTYCDEATVRDFFKNNKLDNGLSVPSEFYPYKNRGKYFWEMAHTCQILNMGDNYKDSGVKGVKKEDSIKIHLEGFENKVLLNTKICSHLVNEEKRLRSGFFCNAKNAQNALGYYKFTDGEKIMNKNERTADNMWRMLKACRANNISLDEPARSKSSFDNSNSRK